MTDRIPSFFLLVPGPWEHPREVIDALRARGISAAPRAGTPALDGVYVDVVADRDLARGFAWGPDGALPDDVVALVDGFGRAALVEIAQRLDRAAARAAALGRALRDVGGVAVRMEGSGAASTWEPWLARLDSGLSTDLYAASVIRVQDDDTQFTCGMHQFELPDAEIAMADPDTAARWLAGFGVFQLAEDPALASGHTFRPDDASPRRAFERWPDHRHHPDDGRHNPFGVWRFLPEGAPGLGAQDLVPTIIPALVAQLLAAERAKGSALTRMEVERLVAEAPAMAVDARRALALERSRGYADLEPRRAWEQWQLVRATLV
ncbi:MAG: hypothetical protein KC464_19980 [Myxococcales bacterium]|nr:hypothetical protein [Myxococcales bacterium]